MTRRVFFSFHYEPDIFRVQVVRQSALTHDLDDQDSFFDGGLWESAKTQSPEKLKLLITRGMEGSSVVCVLAGTMTCYRPWVRYEIARAVVENKGLLTVHINDIRCAKTTFTSTRGQDPLEFMGVLRHNVYDSYHLVEFVSGTWKYFADYTAPVTLPKYLGPMRPGEIRQLSEGTQQYDYAQQNGYSNLSRWIEDAALAVGR